MRTLQQHHHVHDTSIPEKKKKRPRQTCQLASVHPRNASSRSLLVLVMTSVLLLVLLCQSLTCQALTVSTTILNQNKRGRVTSWSRHRYHQLPQSASDSSISIVSLQLASNSLEYDEHEEPKEPSNEPKKKKETRTRSLMDDPRSIQYTFDESRVHTGHDWGIHRPPPPDNRHQTTSSYARLYFPRTVDEIAQGAAQAVTLALVGDNDKSMDPHLWDNLWAGDRYSTDRRPVRTAADRGRLGLEVDGSLVPGQSPPATVRRVALSLAHQLSHCPAWTNNGEDHAPVPVVLYCNTMAQTLAASREWSLERKRHETSFSTAWESSISILSLSQGADLPSVLKQHVHANTKSSKQKSLRRRSAHRSRLKGNVDPRNGIIVVVQPTDFNQEYEPPGPALDALGNLQQLVARASVAGVPVIVVSPRFLMAQGGGGLDQSGYQQSAAFGGTEPPPGPTPWLLRDFGPPIYSWVGEVMKLRRPPRDQVNTDDSVDDHHSLYYYSKIAMVQSMAHRQRAWHIFAERSSYPRRQHDDDNDKTSRDYEYLASTKSSAGRPTREICCSIWQEFASFSLNPEDEE